MLGGYILMSLFSTLFGRKEHKRGSVVVGNDVIQYLDDNFFKYIVDRSEHMTLCFLEGQEWIWANRNFLETTAYKDINDFRKDVTTIRDLFLNESEDIFTESDKSWLDYIKKYRNDGYRVHMTSKNKNEVLVIDVYCTVYPRNKNLYILELRDVTQLYKARVKTKEIENLKMKFLSNIGHEFRTPMNAILGFIDLLKETELDAKQIEYINMITRSSTSLMQNVETLLDLSQLQSGKLELQKESFNLLPAIEKISYSSYQIAKERGVKFFSFIDPKIPQILYGDLERITQVISALSKNAIKFTPKGKKVILEVKLLKRTQNGDCSISFGIKDDGNGFSAEQIALIEEPFTAENHADEKFGVGLSFSSGLVKLMDSKLHIHSERGRGTYINFLLNFQNAEGQNYKMVPKRKVKVLLLDSSRVDEANFLTIYLRSFSIDVLKANHIDENLYKDIDALYIVADQSDSSWMLDLGTYSKKVPVTLLLDEDESLQTKLKHIIDEVLYLPLVASTVAKHLYAFEMFDPKFCEAPIELHLKDEIKALVVEDNLINQKLVQILLEEYDIVVSTAVNGLEAIDLATKNSYDIVFMDIDMPEMNGIVATKLIKERMSREEKLPIVALTAMAMEGDKEMLLREGLDDYLSKPLTREKLEAILDKYLKVTA